MTVIRRYDQVGEKKDDSMSSNERSTPTGGSTAAVAETNSAHPPRRQSPIGRVAVWARFVAAGVVVVAVLGLDFYAGSVAAREDPYLFANFENSFVSPEDMCLQRVCSPAGRFGQHCRQVWVPC